MIAVTMVSLLKLIGGIVLVGVLIAVIVLLAARR